MRPGRSLAITVLLCVAPLVATVSVAAASITATPKCDGVRLRTGPSTAYATKLVIDLGTKVTVVDEVAGGRWSTVCGGRSYAGSKWARVSAVNGVTVKSRFGIDALYAAADLLREIGPVATTAPPRATSTPSAAGTPSPAATPATTTPGPSPPASPTASAAASASAPVGSGSSPGAGPGGQTGGPAGPMSDSASTVELGILVLALVSIVLSVIVYWQRRRRGRHGFVSKVPPSRLDDARS